MPFLEAVRDVTLKRHTWEHTFTALQKAKDAMRALAMSHYPEPEHLVYKALEAEFVTLHRSIARLAAKAGAASAEEPTAPLPTPEEA